MNNYVFEGRTAVLTGAASGIGAALAVELARRGSDLALIDRDRPGLARTEETISRFASSRRISTHIVDLSEHSDFISLATDVAKQHARIGLLINNAGVALGGRVEQISMDDFDWLTSINLRAPVALTKAFLPYLRETPGAHITNVSSLFGLVGPAGQAAYSASKFGLRGFTLSLQAELIPQGIGVTVVHPGGIATNIANSARVPQDAEDAVKSIDQMNALLTFSPDRAARHITNAIHKRRERLVITRGAIVADILARTFPARHRSMIARAMAD
ncbi:SDR family NAD(P)-dependent oxidoreductase [Pseudarthrobacter scleromae]|uniref:SDR family NAD(P)-dependent oxidoreductase n=1 Tax=Pseudarthrobacter scleromae TaxID=158897 RepID=UPI003CFE2E42